MTFQDEKVNSRATSEYGWRVTPYAYLLLKARGPKVDKIAAAAAGPRLHGHLRLRDPARRVAADSRSTPRRPAEASARIEKLQITQSLDERQAKDGKLILEVKATARGLVPDLETILDVAGARASSSRRSTTRASRSRSSIPTARRTWSTRSAPGWSTSGRPDRERSRPRRSSSRGPRSTAPR